MREVFASREPADPGRVFYTIRPEDVGKSAIDIEIGIIHVSEILGRVLKIDVGKRLYRVPTDDAGGWAWQAENDAQFKQRTGKDKSCSSESPG